MKLSFEHYGISREELAKVLRISVRTLYRRMNDQTTWTVGELKRMGELFGWERKELAEFVEHCSRYPL